MDDYKIVMKFPTHDFVHEEDIYGELRQYPDASLKIILYDNGIPYEIPENRFTDKLNHLADIVENYDKVLKYIYSNTTYYP
jgi:hypothetical protein